MNRDTILKDVLFPAILEIKENVEKAEALVPDEGTLLFGVDAPLDSIALVGLVVAVEERLELLTGKSIRLVDERAMSMKKSPFRSVGSFADYIDSVLAEAL